ncbi:MAG: response regulator [Acidobacteria bacterium]|nr:response regulator [Acidobacteriota bacterium]
MATALAPHEPALLLVDDVDDNLVAVDAALAPLGHRTIRARSGPEALRQLLTEDVAVIVLDVQMPGMDGFATAAAIKQRERSREIPILFLTAIDREPHHQLKGLETGAVDYLFKPVDPELLRAKVGVFLELQLKTRELRSQGDALARRTAALQRSNEDLEEFCYIASHDLQEPLRAVAGYLELLVDELGGALEGEAAEWVARARSAVSRSSNQIDDLLAYARAGTDSPTGATASLDEAVTDALHQLDRSVLTTGAAIEVGSLGRASAALTDLIHVFQNLIGNAIKYAGSQAPQLHISASRSDGLIEVAVRDRGVGVDEDDLERAFGRFERVGGQPAPGTGLGLAVCRRLVERSGGRIWMERNGEAGVTVRFTLPEADDA